MAGKPLFAGLSIDDPKPSQIYNANFARQQYAESARAHLQTPITPPERRPIPGRSKYDPPKADARLTMTRSAKGVRNSVGTTSVPTGLRKTAGEKLRPKKQDGRRKTRSLVGYPTRSKSAEKIVYSGRVGMTATRRMTSEMRADVETRAVAQTLVKLASRARDTRESAASARKRAKDALADAIGREREANARGDVKAAESARTDIRKFRQASKFKGV